MILDGSRVGGINDKGQIAGSTGTTGEITTLGGPITTFMIPGSTSLYVNGINNLGQVVGQAHMVFCEALTEPLLLSMRRGAAG
jgi:hypothetical protein